jgi:hypothetical protein
MFVYRSTVFLLTSLLASPLLFADWEAKLLAVLEQAQIETHQAFSYTQTIDSESNGLEISRFDAEREPSWELISLNGESPTDKERKKFQKDKVKEAERREETGSLVAMIEPGSVQVAEETAELVTLSFAPKMTDFPEDAQDALAGEAIWNKAQARLISLTVSSKAPFKPALGVKVNNMEMVFEFHEVAGYTLPEAVRFAFEGKLAGVKSIDVESTIAYTDYEPKAM